MNNERGSDVVVIVLEALLQILKAIKKLQSLFKKKTRGDSLVSNHFIYNETNGNDTSNFS